MSAKVAYVVLLRVGCGYIRTGANLPAFFGVQANVNLAADLGIRNGIVMFQPVDLQKATNDSDAEYTT